MQEAHWGVIPGSTPVGDGGKPDWAEGAGGQARPPVIPQGALEWPHIEAREPDLCVSTLPQSLVGVFPCRGANLGRGSAPSSGALSSELSAVNTPAAGKMKALVLRGIRATHHSIQDAILRSWDFSLRIKRSY